MAANQEINYKSCLESFTKIYFPRVKVDKNAFEIISNIINDVNSNLISHIEKEYISGSKVNVNFLHYARKAIHEIFPGNLNALALSEASKQLVLLEIGYIEFGKDVKEINVKKNVESESTEEKVVKKTEPTGIRLSINKFAKGIGNLFSIGTKGEKDTKSKSTNKEIDSKSVNRSVNLFQKGIEKLLSKVFPNFNIETNAAKTLAFSIHMFSKMIAEKASEKFGSKDELQPRDLRTVLSEYLVDDVLRNAITEGNKSLLLYEDGLIKFKPKKTATSDRRLKAASANQISSTDFKLAIKTLMNEIDTQYAVDTKAQKHLGQILKSIASYVAVNTSETCRKENISEMKEREIYECIRATFPHELKQLAMAKGTNNIIEFQNGIISYKRTSLTEERRKSKSNRKKSKSSQRTTRTSLKKQSSPKSKSRRQKSTSKSSTTSRKRKTKSTSIDTQKNKKLKKTEKSGKLTTRSAVSSKMHAKTKKSEPKKIGSKSGQKKQKTSPKSSSTSKKRKSSPKSSSTSKKRKSSPKSSSTSKKRKSSPKSSSTSKRLKSKSTQEDQKRMKTANLENLAKYLKSGVSEAFTSVEISLEKETSKNLTQALADVCDVLITISISQSGNSKELGAKEIKTALLELFPKELAQHALVAAINELSYINES